MLVWPSGRIVSTDPSSEEVQAQVTGAQDHPWLHSDFEATLGYLVPLKKKKEATT